MSMFTSGFSRTSAMTVFSASPVREFREVEVNEAIGNSEAAHWPNIWASGFPGFTQS